MKKLALVVLASLIFSGICSVAMAETSGKFSTTVLPKYMVGNGTVVYDHSVIQKDLFISFSNGTYIDIWDSYPISGEAGPGKEIDWSIGYTGKLPALNANFDVGISYVDLYRLFGSTTSGDVVFTHAEISKNIGSGFSPYGKVQTFTATTEAVNPRTTYQLIAGMSHELTIGKIGISNKAHALYEITGGADRSGFLLQHWITLSVPLSKTVSANVFNTISIPLMKDHRETEIFPGGTLSMSF